ncbi:MAG: divalent-cation tolerance protein CutA [Pseudomonadota bacterium]|nr:divalent-cation tolerance protein CutA [Pseudomonadota bacterium]
MASVKFCWIYTTVKNKKEALRISRVLVSEKLVACANIFSGMESVYRWKGKIETSREVGVIFKTRSTNYTRVEKRIIGLHSYECPCVVMLPLAKGSRSYLKWLAQNTQ